MDRWTWAGAAVVGTGFAISAYARFDHIDSATVRVLVGVFLFGLYSGVVVLGTEGKKRSLSSRMQVALGVAFSCAIAALAGASTEGYILAVLLGLVLGLTADMWVMHVDIT